MTIWAAISWYSAGPVNLNSLITASDYVDILDIQEHPVVQIHPYSQPELFCLEFNNCPIRYDCIQFIRFL